MKLLFLATLIVSLISIMIYLGCQTRPIKFYQAPFGQYSLLIAEQPEIQKLWNLNPNNSKKIQVAGFTDTNLLIHFVMYGNDLEPDFATLGHEYFHELHLGGDFHKNK